MKQLLLALTVMIFTANQGFAQDSQYTKVRVKYVYKKGDTLSTILYSYGVGHKSSPHRLFGKHGWVERNKALNPQISDWEEVDPGIELTIEYPVTRQKAPTPAAGEPPPSNAEPQVQTPPANATHQSAAGGFVGMRYGKSQAPSGLLSKMSVLSLFGEHSFAKGDKFRVYCDVVPGVHLTQKGQTQKIDWHKIVVGYGFGWPITSILGSFYLTPKAGIYSIDAAIEREVKGSKVIDPVSQSSVLAAGLDVEFEQSLSWAIWRLWAGIDIAGPIGGSEDSDSTQLIRSGLDLYLDGPILSGSRLRYLAFGLWEKLMMETEDRFDADQDERVTLEIGTLYLGVGLSLSY